MSTIDNADLLCFNSVVLSADNSRSLDGIVTVQALAFIV